VLHNNENYWAINDSGNSPSLFEINEQGLQLNEYKLPFANLDWEDLASFESDDSPWIMIADTGDNARLRRLSTLYFVAHPGSEDSANLSPGHRLDFVYEDGPQNVESVSVSTVEKKIYLISKGASGANIYTLPLILEPYQGLLTAVRVGQLGDLFTATDVKWWERFFAKRLLLSPTSLDISADDRLAVIGNYRHAYLFKRNADENWAHAFSRKPELLLTHRMEQSESISFSSQSDKVMLSSEGLHAPVLVVRPSL